MTYEEELAEVEAAITKILKFGQTFDVNGRTTANAELRTLYARKTQLTRLIARASRGGIRMRQMVPRG